MSISNLFRLPKDIHVKGEIGIEIEVEGSNLPEKIKGWRKDNDGSLRGEAAEYVLAKPILRTEVDEYLNGLQKAFLDNKSLLKDSGRAGIHVHVNVQSLTLTQVYNYICLYLIFEDMLVRYCGEDRVGNLFCLRMRDAEGILIALRDCLVNLRPNTLATDNLRYASVNVLALANYGSLEFRAMRSTLDISVIKKWVDILLLVKDYAVQLDNPRQLVESFSQMGPETLASTVLLNHYKGLSYKGHDHDMWDNVRNVQEIAYCVKWQDVAEWEHRIDNPINPFIVEDALNGLAVRPRGAPIVEGNWAVAPPPLHDMDMQDRLNMAMAQINQRRPRPQPMRVIPPEEQDL